MRTLSGHRSHAATFNLPFPLECGAGHGSFPQRSVRNHPDIESDLTGALCAASEPFVLRILDDSMAPELNAGCIVVIDPTVTPFDGCFVLAELDDTFVVRTYRAADTGYFSLEALDPRFAPIADERIIALLGVVSQRTGARRRDFRRYPLEPPHRP